jgi:phosphoribosylanthranilate isomerase
MGHVSKSLQPIIQIAGIKSLGEANMLIDAGVEWLGFPLRLDVHTPDITESEAAKLIKSISINARDVRVKCKPVLITYLSDAREIVEFSRYLGTKYIQLHGPISNKETEKLRGMDENLFLIKSLVVRSDDKGNNKEELAAAVAAYATWVDAFITDTFDVKTGASGATGKTHDWRLSRSLVEVSPKPVILAGGLNHTNVREAILYVKPAGVDAHTGVESPTGDKDPKLIKAFVSEAKAAFKLIL